MKHHAHRIFLTTLWLLLVAGLTRTSQATYFYESFDALAAEYSHSLLARIVSLVPSEQSDVTDIEGAMVAEIEVQEWLRGELPVNTMTIVLHHRQEPYGYTPPPDMEAGQAYLFFLEDTDAYDAQTNTGYIWHPAAIQPVAHLEVFRGRIARAILWKQELLEWLEDHDPDAFAEAETIYEELCALDWTYASPNIREGYFREQRDKLREDVNAIFASPLTPAVWQSVLAMAWQEDLYHHLKQINSFTNDLSIATTESFIDMLDQLYNERRQYLLGRMGVSDEHIQEYLDAIDPDATDFFHDQADDGYLYLGTTPVIPPGWTFADRSTPSLDTTTYIMELAVYDRGGLGVETYGDYLAEGCPIEAERLQAHVAWMLADPDRLANAAWSTILANPDEAFLPAVASQIEAGQNVSWLSHVNTPEQITFIIALPEHVSFGDLAGASVYHPALAELARERLQGLQDTAAAARVASGVDNPLANATQEIATYLAHYEAHESVQVP